jgi:hypothetical protein
VVKKNLFLFLILLLEFSACSRQGLDRLSPEGNFKEKLQLEDCEIQQRSKIERENFSHPIYPIVFTGGHYYYDDHDFGHTYQNCGLYAIRRLLFHLGLLSIVNADLWDRYTDRGLRNIIVDTLGFNEQYRDQNVGLLEEHVTALMRWFGIPDQYIVIVRRGNYWIRLINGIMDAAGRELEFICKAEKDPKNVEAGIDKGVYDEINSRDVLHDFLKHIKSGAAKTMKHDRITSIERAKHSLENRDYVGW